MSRVNEIRYVGYGVKDLEAEKAFYLEKWGLVQVPSTDGLTWLATQGHDEHHVVRLRQDDSNRIDVIALAAASRTDVDALAAKVKAAGAKIIHDPRALTSPGGGYGFRFFSPDGLTFEVSSDVARGARREIARWEGVPVKISHIVLHSPDHKAAVKFMTEVLGFKVSDWLGDFMAFLRCNSAHHRMAVLPGPPCLNHVAYDMMGVDGMMRGIGRLKKSGVSLPAAKPKAPPSSMLVTTAVWYSGVRRGSATRPSRRSSRGRAATPVRCMCSGSPAGCAVRRSTRRTAAAS